MEEQNISQKNNANQGLFLPISILIAAVLISGSILYTRSASKNEAAPAAPAIAVDIKDVNIEGDPFIGNANAPVTIAYWFDYQCPFCKQFDLTVMPTIVDKYVKTGEAKIVFKNFQFLGNDSQDGALAAKAIWKLYPGSYEKWRVAMMTAQDDEGDTGFGNMQSIITLINAQTPEINADAVVKDVNDNRTTYQAAIDAEKTDAAKFGITGTPGFIIGTHSVSGSQPASVFSGLIDAELKK
jgi:protein-disulfide isomerase